MVFNDLYIQTKNDLAEAVNALGFVPFFPNCIPGFSVKEHIDPAAWFPDEGEGIWEWKGPVIRETHCAYGKFFRNKAVFISEEWFPVFAGLRRDGMDFNEQYELGLISFHEKTLYRFLADRRNATSLELKHLAGFGKEGNKGFDPLMARMQMQTFVLISDFVYKRDRWGMPYGWGVAQYALPERYFGEAFADAVFERSSEESYRMILNHLRRILPHASEKLINSLLKN